MAFKDPFKNNEDEEKAPEQVLNRKRGIAARTTYISIPNTGEFKNLRLFAERETPEIEVNGKFGKQKKFSWTVADLDLVGEDGDITDVPEQKFDVGIGTHKLWSKATEGGNRYFKIVREGENKDTRYVPYPL
jgi:hypothetical protein